MSRYFKVAFIFGVLVGGAVLAAYHFQLIQPFDAHVQRFLGLPDFVSGLRWPYMYAVIPLLALAVCWTTIDITRPSLKAVVAVGAFLLVLSTTYVLALYRHFFAPSAPLLCVMLSFILGMIYSCTTGGRRKRIVRQLFGRRVSDGSFRRLVDEGNPATFQGECLQGTVVMVEVFNHEQLIDKLQPEEYVTVVNMHLSTASQHLVEAGGYLDECDGEGIRALFGTPLEDHDHALCAVKAALSLDRQLRNVNMECDSRWHQTVDYRIGISSGDLVTGAFGSARLGGFSAGGAPVDFARRLCAANLNFGTHVLIASDTYDYVLDTIEVRPIEMVRRTEDGERVEIYEPLALVGEMDEVDRRRQSLFWEGIVYFRERRYDLAHDRFTEVLVTCGEDAAAQHYLERIAAAKSDTLRSSAFAGSTLNRI